MVRLIYSGKLFTFAFLFLVCAFIAAGVVYSADTIHEGSEARRSFRPITSDIISEPESPQDSASGMSVSSDLDVDRVSGDISQDSSSSSISSRSLATNMQALKNKIRKILECPEDDLHKYIHHFHQSDNVAKVEGAENRHALKARAKAVRELIARGREWCDRYAENPELAFVDASEHASPTSIHSEFLEQGAAVRRKYVSIFDEIMPQNTDNLDHWASALSRLEGSVNVFEEDIDGLKEAKILENAKLLLEQVKQEIPQIEAYFNIEVLTQPKIEIIRAHFKKLNTAHKLLNRVTKKLKHTSWVLFSSQHAATVILSAAAATAVGAAVAKVGPYVVSAAIVGSLLYEIYSVYHRARITQAITSKSLLKEMGVILLDDIRNTACYLKGASVNAIKSIVTAPEKLGLFLLKRDHEQARRFLCAELAENLKQELDFLQTINTMVNQDLEKTQITRIRIKSRNGRDSILCSAVDILAEYSVAANDIKTYMFLQLRDALVSLLDPNEEKDNSTLEQNIIDLLRLVLVKITQDDEESKALRASAESILRNLDLVSEDIEVKVRSIVEKIKASPEYQDRVRSLASQPLAGGDAQPSFMNEEDTPAKVGRIEGFLKKFRRRKGIPSTSEKPLLGGSL